MVVFNLLTIEIPIMEIVESGIKMTVKVVSPGFLFVVDGLRPLYLCRIVFASLGIVAEVYTYVPVNVGPARVFG